MMKVLRLLVLLLLCSGALACHAAPKPFISGSMAKLSQHKTPHIISFWSIDCIACYKEFELWKQLSKRYPKLKITLVSTDSQDMQAQVIQALQEQGLTHLPAWQFADSNAQKLRYEIDPNWYGELPRSYFFAPNKQPVAHSGVVELEMVEKWLGRK